ncbi:MAG: hypothetical protein K6A98_06995 [Prevotella sp.]|nr:hypothetical protein [Prevotella sp.]
MDNFLTAIDRQAKQSLPAIATHTPLIGLFAGSIELNTKVEKYNLFATPGEATPIAYERKETMAAFVGHLCNVMETGQDMRYQATMRASTELRGCKVLIYSNADLKLTDEDVCLPLPTDMSEYETANVIAAQVREHEAKAVIIDDATSLLANNPREAIIMLNTIANVQGFMLLYGINTAEATDNALTYLASHAHNLCQLTEAIIELTPSEAEPQTVNYFCFTYGKPTPHRIVYTIDEAGNVTIPPHVTDLLRMEDCGRLLASKGVPQPRFIDSVFGYLKGQYKHESIRNMISEATEYGILQKSGEGSKITIKWAEAAPSRNPYKGNIVLTALGDASSKATGYTRKRKGVAKFGEFKLLNLDNDIAAKMGKNVMAYLARAIATKGQALGRCIEVKTTHRNTLVIIVGEKGIAEKFEKYVGKPNNADFEFVSTNGEITDNDLLHLYRAKANQKPRDIVLIVGLNDATPTDYTPMQLAKELALTARQRGFLAIAQTSGWSFEDLAQFTGDEAWIVRPLISKEDSEYMDAEHDISFPDYYIFEATAGSFPFRGKFTSSGNKPNRDDFKKAMLTSMFYWCKKQPAYDTLATDTNIRQARKAGLIKVTYTSREKRLNEALITFVGSQKRRQW